MNRQLQWALTVALCANCGIVAADNEKSPLIDSLGTPPVAQVAYNDSELVEVEPLAPARLAEELILEEPTDLQEAAVAPEPVASTPATPITETPAEPAATTPVVEEEVVQEAVQQAELVKERFADGKIKIERFVIQDEDQNYVNHGLWKMWDTKGNVIAEGDYKNGKRDGEWVGWFFPGEVTMLQGLPYKSFAGPFVSQAKFRNGILHGSWTIYDSKKRTVSEFYYDDGERHGIWTWWYPNGQKMREMEYEGGEIEGELVEWKDSGDVIGRDTYIRGRRLALEKELFNDGSQKSAGMYLHAQQIPSGKDSWWNCDIAPFMVKGKDEKHGTWTSWHPSGQERMRGEYRFNVPVGAFTWWYPNGQKALQGKYSDGLQEGSWTWWHENGLKSIAGHYVAGKSGGKWIWWHESGKVAQRAAYENGVKTAERIEPDVQEPARLK